MNRDTQLTNLAATGKLTRLDVDSGTLYVDTTNNRVGIGTTTPGSALEVNGTITGASLIVDNIEIDTTGATSNQVLQYNGTKFAPATPSSGGGDPTPTVFMLMGA